VTYHQFDAFPREYRPIALRKMTIGTVNRASGDGHFARWRRVNKLES
jgi:hypothetical protein